MRNTHETELRVLGGFFREVIFSHFRMRWLDGIPDARGMNLGKLWERDREACCTAVCRVAKSQTWQQQQYFSIRKAGPHFQESPSSFK